MDMVRVSFLIFDKIIGFVPISENVGSREEFSLNVKDANHKCVKIVRYKNTKITVTIDELSLNIKQNIQIFFQRVNNMRFIKIQIVYFYIL